MLFGAVGSRFSGLNGHLQAELVAQRHELVHAQRSSLALKLGQTSLAQAYPRSELRLRQVEALASATQERRELGGCHEGLGSHCHFTAYISI
jgi:hypothetical protein